MTARPTKGQFTLLLGHKFFSKRPPCSPRPWLYFDFKYYYWTITRQKKLKGKKLIFLCNLWMEFNLPYLIWKLRMSPFICYMVASSAPTGCRVTDQNEEGGWQTPARPQNMVIKYLSVGHMSRFLYQQIALDVLFQMRNGSLPNSN